ncbi:MAG: hypothetical protein LBM92_06775, partial [Opitutaceae bacterium]|nr:hypothetical protein [Opitutaceae bacterium]
MNPQTTAIPSPTPLLSRAGKPALLCALCAFVANFFPLHAATYTWTGSAGDNDWHNAANWDAGTVPLQTDIVVFNTIAGPVFDSVSATAATLNIGNTA